MEKIQKVKLERDNLELLYFIALALKWSSKSLLKKSKKLSVDRKANIVPFCCLFYQSSSLFRMNLSQTVLGKRLGAR